MRRFLQKFAKKYPFQDAVFNKFAVEFTNTTEKIKIPGQSTIMDENTYQITLPIYEKINNEPNILTMAVMLEPSFDVNIDLIESNKSVCITSVHSDKKLGPNRFLVRTKMIDTTKYNHFIVN